MARISLKNVFLNYPIYGTGNRSLKNVVMSAATGGLISRNNRIPIVKALEDVSFELADGDRVGLIGHNGAGKSTLLKVLAGIYAPTAGHLETDGRIVSTINLSVGLEPEATGIENIYIRALLLGMKKEEIKRKIDGIAEFTGLGDYLNLPVRVYSAGMSARLAFATVTSLESDILIMDEEFGAGDESFMEKVNARLSEFVQKSRILVIASHHEDVVRKFCNKAILMEHGKILAISTIDNVFERYRKPVRHDLTPDPALR